MRARQSPAVLCAALMAAASPAGCAWAADDARAAPAHGAWTLTLENCLEDGQALTLHLRSRSGLFTQFWATWQRDNTAHGLDVSALKLEGAALTGQVKSNVSSVLHDLRVSASASDSVINGSFEGTYGAAEPSEVAGQATGALAVRPGPGVPVEFDLRLGKVLAGGNNTQRNTFLRFKFRGGKAEDVAITSEAGPTAWTGEINKAQLTYDGRALKGTVALTVSSRCPLKSGPYEIGLDCEIVGVLVTGSVNVTLGGKQVVRWQRFAGSVQAAGSPPDPLNCVYTLQLDKAAGGDEPLAIYLDSSQGTFKGIAVAGQRGHAPHELDASALRLDGGKLSGQLTIKVNSGGWAAKQYRPVAFAYSLDAAVKGAEVSGSYRGRSVVKSVSGAIRGKLESWAAIEKQNALAPGQDYPRWRGAAGGGAGVDAGWDLVDWLGAAKLVWKSEERTPNSWIWGSSRGQDFGGGYSTPVVAEGRVFLAYYLPTGLTRAEWVQGSCGGMQISKLTGRIEADDILLCMDGRTGRTLWKTVLKGKGFFGGSSGVLMTPCAAAGKVFFTGSAGRVHCVNAADGTPLWEGSLGEEAQRIRQLARQSAEGKEAVPGFKMDLCGSPAVADGVVACNDNKGGLIGFDAATGNQIWGPIPDCVAKTCSPVRWLHQGREYFIAAAYRAVCVEPRTGRVVWEQPDVANGGTVAVCENYMVFSGGGKKKSAKPAEAGPSGGMSCYRIDAQGAKLAWDLGAKYNNHVTSPLIYRGHAWGFWEEETICVSLETGKIVAACPFPGVRSCSSLVAADGRLLREHLYQQLFFFKADPNDFRRLGETWWRPPSHAECTTSVIADGRLFLRGKDCVYCYDLRK